VVSIILDADCNEVELPSVLENVIDMLESGGVSESSIVSADINCGSIRVDLTMDSAESAAAVEVLVSSAGGFNVPIDGITFAASLATQNVDGAATNSQHDGGEARGKGNGGGVAVGVVGALLAVFVLVGGAYFYKRRVDEANNITEMQNNPIGVTNFTFGNVAAAGSTAGNGVVESMSMSTFAASGSRSGNRSDAGAAGESRNHEATSTEVVLNSDAQYHMATPTNAGGGGSSGDAQYHEATSTEVGLQCDAQYRMATPTGQPTHTSASPVDYRVVAGALASAASPANDYALPEGYLTMGNGDGDGGLDSARSSMMSETSFGLSAQGSFKVNSVRRVNPLQIESDDASGEEREVMPSQMGTVMEEDADVGSRPAPPGTTEDPAALPRMERRVSLVDEEELLFVTRVSEAGLPVNKDDDGGGNAGWGRGTGSHLNDHDADVIAGSRSTTRSGTLIDENAFVRKVGGGFRLASVRKTQTAAVANEADTVGAATMDVAAEA
jgi:hypothetical protein